jgi:hypothetical protein
MTASESEKHDIRASVTSGSDGENTVVGLGEGGFTARWTGKFSLPQPDTEDLRLTRLLEKYDLPE